LWIVVALTHVSNIVEMHMKSGAGKKSEEIETSAVVEIVVVVVVKLTFMTLWTDPLNA
jgi:hypothetical protein